MRPILFEKNATTFTTNGLGRLDPISCFVTEERNGQYELEMVVSVDDAHYADIIEGRILYVRHDETPDKQPFEIYYISRPLNEQVTVLAHHISYRTATITVMPFTASSITAAMVELKTNSVADNPFTLSTTKSVSANFTLSQPATLRSLLAGESGSLLDVYGTGEYEWDKFNIKLHLNRGRDSGVTLRYGKDITELNKITDTSSIWTGVVPYWIGTSAQDSSQEEIVTLTEKVIYGTTVNNYAYRMVVPLDLSSEFQSKPTEAQLRLAAQNYVANNEITAIPTSIDVSFVNAAQLEEYREVAALQQLRLCDTLSIVHTRLGVSAQAKIVKVVYDVIQERYSSMTVGEVRSNLATTLTGGLKASIDDLNKRINRVHSQIEQEMEDAIAEQTTKIIGGAGGYIVIQMDANGKPREIYAMNTDDVNTATQVLRINQNGIGFSSTGINGPYRSAWTLDGKFVADFIQSGTLSASLIYGGVLVIGGNNNANGQLLIKNASGTTIGEIGYDGISIWNSDGSVKQFYLDSSTGNVTFTGALNAATGTFAGSLSAATGTFAGIVNINRSMFDYNSLLKMTDGNRDEVNIYCYRHDSHYYEPYIELKGYYDTTERDIAELWYTGLYLHNHYLSGAGKYAHIYYNHEGFKVIYSPTDNPMHIHREIIAYIDEFGHADLQAIAVEDYLNVYGNLTAYSNLTVQGTKSRSVQTDQYSERLLYCYETPTPMFGDIGEGTIGEDGLCYISIDPIFAQTIVTNQYQVFLQRYGSGDCWVKERNGGYFVVQGTPGLSFGWEIKAKQKGYDQKRLDRNDEPFTVPISNYGVDAAQYIDSIQKVRTTV